MVLVVLRVMSGRNTSRGICIRIGMVGRLLLLFLEHVSQSWKEGRKVNHGR